MLKLVTNILQCLVDTDAAISCLSYEINKSIMKDFPLQKKSTPYVIGVGGKFIEVSEMCR